MGSTLVFVSRTLPGITRLGCRRIIRLDQGPTESLPNRRRCPDNSIAMRQVQPETSRVSSAFKPVFSVPVRELIEFVLRSGNLGGERDFVGSDRALAGIRGHQRIQRTRPAGYQKEISVSHELITEESILRIHGRIDGLLITAEEVLLEEIKTTRGAWDRVADPLHWAQAKFYGFIYSHDHALETITLQLTYLDLETGELTEFRELFSHSDLGIFFNETTAIYLEWVQEHHRWCQ